MRQPPVPVIQLTHKQRQKEVPVVLQGVARGPGSVWIPGRSVCASDRDDTASGSLYYTYLRLPAHRWFACQWVLHWQANATAQNFRHASRAARGRACL